jgi:phosphoglucosamine mutase
VDFLKSTMDTPLDGLKVVLDCANGAAYRAAEMVYRQLGAEVTVIANQPDGININEGCGSTHPEKLQDEVRRLGADIGLAYDGDADRLIAVDETGQLVDGDKAIYICAKMLKETGQLKGDLVTATVMSNLGFHKAIESLGCRVEVTGVGDRYVLESMLKTGCVIGGEQSGHIIFLNHTTTGDGILSSLQLIKALRLSGKTLSQLAAEVSIYPQVLVNARIRNENKKKYTHDEEIQRAIQVLEERMAGEGRVLIRPSGTEPLVRVMLEGPQPDLIDGLARELAALITSRLG